MRTISPFIKSSRLTTFGWRSFSIFFVMFIAVFGAWAQHCTAPGPGNSAATCTVQYKVSGADLSKCGYQEYTNVNPPRVTMYHLQKIKTIYNYKFRQYTTNGFEIGDNCWNVVAQDGTYFFNITDDMPSFTETDDTEYSTNSGCWTTNSYDGIYTHEAESHDSRSTEHDPNAGCASCQFFTTDSYDKQDIVITPVLTNGGWVSIEHTTDTNYAIGQTSCGGPLDPTGGSDSTASGPVILPINAADLLTGLSQNNKTYTISSPNDSPGPDYTQSETGSQTWDLSYPYTDDELRGHINDLMPDFPSDWYVEDSELQYMCAYSIIDGSHRNGGIWTASGDAELQKMKYRFAVNVGSSFFLKSYMVTWDLVTYDIPDGTVYVQSMSASVSGIADLSGNLYTIDQDAPAPKWDTSTDPLGGMVITLVENVSVSEVDSQSSAAGNVSGFGIASSASSGCSSCGGGGNQNRGAAAASVSFSLGDTTNGLSSSPLMLSVNQPSLASATPGALNFPANDPQLEVITLSGQPRQISSPEAFIDIVTNNQFSYEMRYYLRSQRGSFSSGLYGLSGSPSPFVTWKIENPDASTNTYNRLRLTETRGSDIKVYDYTYAGTANCDVWKLDYPSSLREDEMAQTVVTNISGGQHYYTRYETNIIRVSSGPTQFKRLRVYQKFDGDEGFEYLVRDTIDPDNNPKTTAYTYYDGYVPNGSRTPIKLVTHSDGSWEYYKDYDSLIRPGTIFSSYGDIPVPSGEPDNTTCRYSLVSYASQDSSVDDGTQFPDEPRSVAILIKNNYVSQNYMVAMLGEKRDIRCPYLGSLWDDSRNLVTITKYYTNGVNANRVKSIENPDGTMSFYDYGTAADGTQTNIVSTGEPDSGKTSIIDGTESVTILGPLGQMLSQTKTDIASGIVTTQDTYGNYDSLNRPQQVTHLDGTTDQTQYACCGVDNTTDRDGVVTQYLYDAMKRQIGSSQLSITTTNVFDAIGHTLKTIRVGSDNSQIVMSQSAYNVAGQLMFQTNALGGVATYIHATNSSTGAKVEININSDGGIVTNFFYVDGSLKETIGSAVHGLRYEYDGGYGYTTTTMIKINTNGSDTAEAITNYSDAVGKNYQTVYSDNAKNQSFYNGLGQLWKTIDPDGVTTLYQYNGKGEQEYTAIDMDQNDAIDFSGTDRITRAVSDLTTDSGVNVRRTRTYVWSVNGSSVSNLVSTSESSVDGLHSWQTQYRDASTPVTSQSVTVFSTGGNRYATNISSDGSYTVSAYLNGRVTSVTRKDSAGSQLSSTSYAYDAHGRQYSSTDARNGATTYSYNNADEISSATTPIPGNGGAAQTTITYYNTSLQATNVVNPDQTSVITEYLPTGELQETHGSRTYPVAYTYDYAGRMKTMKTWQNFAGNSGTATTTWGYDGYRGFLTNKTYDGGTSGPGYTYTPAGRLATRVWARGITTTYNYDYAGGLTNVAYDDGVTPAITNTYDRLSRTIQVGTGNLVSQYSYNPANELLVETNTVGILAGFAVTNGYDSYMRRTDLSAIGSGVLSHAAYTYNAGSRLFMVSDGTNNATYTYAANSPLVSQIAFKSNSVIRLTTTKSYDHLNRLTQITNTPSASPAVTFSYTYDNADQRTKNAFADGSYWVYQYDGLGQVTSGKKYWADGTPVTGQQFEYGFDDIGNRKQTKTGGDETGLNLRVANYSDNNLNQITARDVPGYADIMGVALATNTVTVNSQAAYRKGEYFRKELSVNNSSTAAWNNITVASPGQTSVMGNKYVAKTAEAFNYDADGNLTNDGRWTYTWDGENRLVIMTVNTNIGPQYQIRFTYDAKDRCIQKLVTTNGVSIYTNRFLYDRLNLIAEIGANASPICGYLWGLDLSRSIQGAGGIGGLLQVSFSDTLTNCFVAFDGNGNISGLFNADDGTGAANYEYSPFGELLRITGPLAKANHFRFSTRYQDDESDLLHYHYRAYNPAIARFLSRDPNGMPGLNGGASTMDGGNIESGFDGNLYCFARNNPANGVDPLGLEYSCGSALVDIFVPKGHRFNENQMKAELESIAPNALGVYWDIIPGDLPAGSNLGYQGNDFDDRNQCLCIFYLKVNISDRPPTDGGAVIPQLDALGYASIGDWEANGFPEQFYFDYDQDKEYLPSNWQQQNSSAGWKQSSGFIMAHEVVHAIGGKHNGPSGTLMNESISWKWLNLKTVPITLKTIQDVRYSLLRWHSAPPSN